MRLLLLGLDLLSIMGTFLPLVRKDRWWIRMFDFPRVQVTMIAALALAAHLMEWGTGSLLNHGLTMLLVACIGYQAYRIYPYTFLARKQVLNTDGKQAHPRFSLLISNVLMSNRQGDRYIDIVRSKNPDIILVAEADHWWEKQLRAIEPYYPFTLKYPLENTYGMLLYSKLKLIDPKVDFLIEQDIPSMHMLVELDSGDVFEMHGLHPKPPYPAESATTAERDAELLLVGKAVRASDKPIIVAGDLNDVAWSHTTRLFQKISGLLDPRIGRGFYNTFHAAYPFLLRWPLDHVFHSTHFKLVSLERLPYFGSDHFPVYIELSYEPENQAEQEAPTADREERQEAQEKIEKAL